MLREVDLVGPDAIVSLGDLVGYNADPDACAEAVLARAAAGRRFMPTTTDAAIVATAARPSRMPQ